MVWSTTIYDLRFPTAIIERYCLFYVSYLFSVFLLLDSEEPWWPPSSADDFHHFRDMHKRPPPRVLHIFKVAISNRFTNFDPFDNLQSPIWNFCIQKLHSAHTRCPLLPDRCRKMPGHGHVPPDLTVTHGLWSLDSWSKGYIFWFDRTSSIFQNMYSALIIDAE